MKIILCLSILLTFGCAKKDATAELDMAETAQQIGDVMASIDEAGGSSGTIANLEKSAEKTFARYSPNTSNKLNKATLVSQIIQPEANATACTGFGFAGCTTGTITRTFGGCTVGEATFTGTVVLSWTGTGAGSCTLVTANNDYLTRVPNFSVTGRRGAAVLAVTKTGTYGQKLALASISGGGTKTFSLTSDGINRKFTLSGTTLFNQTTTIPSAISVIGTARSSRVLSGGSLRVTNDMTAVTCDYIPSAVTWTASCNCPTSGTWNGSCSSGSTSVLTMTGCGTGTYTEGSTTTTVALDRCGT